MSSLLILFTVLSFLSITNAQERSHGLDSQNPTALSPEAYIFFHPNALQPSTSSLPLAAANVKSTPASESHSTGGRGVPAGSIVAILFGFVFVGLIGMGVYHVVNKRRVNVKRENTERVEEV